MVSKIDPEKKKQNSSRILDAIFSSQNKFNPWKPITKVDFSVSVNCTGVNINFNNKEMPTLGP